MFHPAEYYAKIVKPTAQDFLANRDDIRWAMFACMTTLHVVDYVFQHRHSDAKDADNAARAYKRQAIKRCFAFEVVCGFALASKHCRLSQDSLKDFDSKRYMVATPAFVGERASVEHSLAILSGA